MPNMFMKTLRECRENIQFAEQQELNMCIKVLFHVFESMYVLCYTVLSLAQLGCNIAVIAIVSIDYSPMYVDELIFSVYSIILAFLNMFSNFYVIKNHIVCDSARMVLNIASLPFITFLAINMHHEGEGARRHYNIMALMWTVFSIIWFNCVCDILLLLQIVYVTIIKREPLQERIDQTTNTSAQVNLA